MLNFPKVINLECPKCNRFGCFNKIGINIRSKMVIYECDNRNCNSVVSIESSEDNYEYLVRRRVWRKKHTNRGFGVTRYDNELNYIYGNFRFD